MQSKREFCLFAAATRVVQTHKNSPLTIDQSAPPLEVEILEPRDPYPPLCQGWKEIDRFLVSGMVPDVTKDDLEAYFANMGNAEVADVQFSLKPGVAMVIFEDRPGNNTSIHACAWVCGI